MARHHRPAGDLRLAVDISVGSPLWADVEPRVVALAEAFGRERTVDRLVADPGLGGSWGSYYDEWGFALVLDDDPLYAVVPALRSAAGHGVTAGTFGKWNADLRRIVGAQPRMALAGVSTDCCVIATALPDADAGASVRVMAAACAGSTAENGSGRSPPWSSSAADHRGDEGAAAMRALR